MSKLTSVRTATVGALAFGALAAVFGASGGLSVWQSGAPSALSARLQTVEHDWAQQTRSGFSLTQHDAAPSSPAADIEGGAVAWIVPAIGRIAVGQSITLAASAGAGHEHVVTEIAVVGHAVGVTPAFSADNTRSLLLTLRAPTTAGQRVQPVQMVVTGAAVPVATVRASSEKAL